MTRIAKTAIILTALLSVTACANTIRGIGRDTANVVQATKTAGSDIANAAE